jgi:MFS family permease
MAAAVVVSLNVGKIPPAMPLLRDTFSLDLVGASLLVSFFQVAGMLFGLFGGMLADRFGPRRTMRIGLSTAALGSVLGAVAPSAEWLLASRTIEGAGFMLTVLPGPTLIGRSVPAASRSALMGAWSAYLPLGMSLGLVVTPLAYQWVGWRPVWWAVAGACLLMVWWVGRTVAPDPGGRPPHGALALVRATLRSPRPWVLALAFGCYAAQWVSVFSFLPTLYTESGIGLWGAGLLTAGGVAVNLAGNVACGPLLQRGVSAARLIAAASVVMTAAAWLCFGSDAPFAWRYAGVLLFSAVGGLIPGTLFTRTAGYAPHPRAVGSTTGLMQQGSTLGQFLAPPVIAAVAAASGGWHQTGWTIAALTGGTLLAAVMIGRFDRQDHARRGPPGSAGPVLDGPGAPS